MSKITTKRRLLFAVYNNLKKIPPREYPSTEEIKIVLEDILPELKKHVEEYIMVVRKASVIQGKIEEFGQEKVIRMVNKLNEGWAVYNKEHGLDDIEVDLSKDALKTLTDQFNREDAKDGPGIWGKNWFVNTDEFMVFSDNLAGNKSSVTLADEDDLVLDEEDDQSGKDLQQAPENK